MHRQLLFLCTGNYYRSRFAEHLFNWLAGERALPWRAFSRGVAIDYGTDNVGPISRNTLTGLSHRGISVVEPHRDPLPLHEIDLAAADLVIALKEAEHRPLLTERYRGWQDRVEYWHIHDVDLAEPDVALAEIEALVRALVERLAQEP